MDKIFEIEGFRREVASYLVNEEGAILATTYRYVRADSTGYSFTGP